MTRAASILGSTDTARGLSLPTEVTAAEAGTKPGSSNAMPRITPSTSVAIGPTVSRLGARGHTPLGEIRPCVVFNPTVPQKADGIRTDPPVSVP